MTTDSAQFRRGIIARLPHRGGCARVRVAENTQNTPTFFHNAQTYPRLYDHIHSNVCNSRVHARAYMCMVPPFLYYLLKNIVATFVDVTGNFINCKNLCSREERHISLFSVSKNVSKKSLFLLISEVRPLLSK